MPKLAANLSTMFGEVDFLDRFARAATAGFKGVECQFPYDYQPDTLRQALAQAGLEQVLINTSPGDFGKGERGIACLPGREQEFRDGLETALDYAKALECTRLHVMAGIVPDTVRRDAAMKTFVSNLEHAVGRCRSAKVTPLIEPINSKIDMPDYLLDTLDLAGEVIQAIGAGTLMVQFDIYHTQIMTGDLSRSIEQWLPMIGHIQIADNPGRHEPGTGEINYRYLLDHIDALGYDGWVGCEYRPLGDTAAGLAWAADYLE